MKLELKHLAPYLPYGVMCELQDQGETKQAKLCGAYSDNSYAFFDTVESEHGYDSIKPILRPLSDLTKEIEHNGKKFIPIQITRNYTDENVSYKLCDKLFEWHFDVFGLIDQGLAIPKQAE